MKWLDWIQTSYCSGQGGMLRPKIVIDSELEDSYHVQGIAFAES